MVLETALTQDPSRQERKGAGDDYEACFHVNYARNGHSFHLDYPVEPQQASLIESVSEQIQGREETFHTLAQRFGFKKAKRRQKSTPTAGLQQKSELDRSMDLRRSPITWKGEQWQLDAKSKTAILVKTLGKTQFTLRTPYTLLESPKEWVTTDPLLS